LQFIQTPKEEILTTFGSLKIQELLITLSWVSVLVVQIWMINHMLYLVELILLK
jgi:hypothetical protein